ncbi:NAD(P)/FAD-dependent oxidoreductase [Nitratireductor soli]|uniref:NAD(P)/FAD-dependent oxidoreductase n=1 Tax=Nitratireductor soli TaxID=1670619 RepID=UPI001FCE08B5|nr:FAD-dependent oxidoreductase [Nitratireductor soli]
MTPGPGDHFDFVRIHADSKCDAYNLLTTQSEEEPFKMQINSWDTGLIMSSFRLDRAGRMIVGGIGDLEGKAQPIHAAWARRKLRRTFPELGDLPFEHAWSGRIAMTHDHIPKIVRFGPDAYACFGYSGRGIGPATAFGMQAAIALLEENEDALPVAAVDDHQEVFVSAKEAFFATGSALSHAVNPLPFR